MRRTARKRLLWSAFTLSVWATATAVAYWGYWKPFYEGYRRFPTQSLTPPRYVSTETMLRLGSLRGDRGSSFPQFELHKRSGDLRVCALGDSFTYGDEVADGHDFPALLQAIFRRHGVTNVEVINFGNSWYGFHQTFILWDEVARRFECDFLLLGPACFQAERDTTFNHAVRTNHPDYLHARYVLDHDDVRRVDVLGRTAAERFDGYFGFLPAWQYLRFDRNPPALLLALLGPQNAARNVFYYDDRAAAVEAHETYRILLRQMAAESGAQILVLHSDHAVVEQAQLAEQPNLAAVQVVRQERFPYAAPGGHYSAFGNRLVAEQFFDYLTQTAPPPNVLSFSDFDGLGGVGDAERRPLSQFERIEVLIAGQPVGFLARSSSRSSERGGSATDLHGSEVSTLVALKDPATSIVDAGFVPLAAPLSGGEELVMRIERNARVDERIVGRLRLLSPNLNVVVAEVPGLSVTDGQLQWHAGAVNEVGGVEGCEVSFLVGSTAILHGEGDSSPVITLEPTVGWLRVLRVELGQYVDIDALAEAGVATFQLVGGEQTVEAPLARWRKQSMRLPEPSPALARRITISAGRAQLGSAAR